ncbi:thioredoxin domain-containing protein [Candidatus Saccharibacteria bacterium]|nr:thioredoxin domain-containing protein [Candidatus Saccharibacteria bacterium]
MRKVIIGIVAALVVVVAVIIGTSSTAPTSNVDVIHEASADTGGIGEKTVGDVNSAELVLYEYADFGCSHCAEWNKEINKLIEKYAGRLALVFRTYNLGYANGPMAAQAVTAAQLQGYFKEYKDIIFTNQVDWFYEEDEDKLIQLFREYFEKVAPSGDAEKFVQDIKSDAVMRRVAYERQLGEKVHITGTPLFRIDGKKVELGDLIKTIEQRLGEK